MDVMVAGAVAVNPVVLLIEAKEDDDSFLERLEGSRNVMALGLLVLVVVVVILLLRRWGWFHFSRYCQWCRRLCGRVGNHKGLRQTVAHQATMVDTKTTTVLVVVCLFGRSTPPPDDRIAAARLVLCCCSNP